MTNLGTGLTHKSPVYTQQSNGEATPPPPQPQGTLHEAAHQSPVSARSVNTYPRHSSPTPPHLLGCASGQAAAPSLNPPSLSGGPRGLMPARNAETQERRAERMGAAQRVAAARQQVERDFRTSSLPRLECASSRNEQMVVPEIGQWVDNQMSKRPSFREVLRGGDGQTAFNMGQPVSSLHTGAVMLDDGAQVSVRHSRVL